MIAVSRKRGVLANHRRELKPVELRHGDVGQDDGDFVPQKLHEGFARGARLDEVLAQSAEDHLIAEQLRRLVVDQQDVHLVLLQHDDLTGAARCAAPREADPC